MGVEKSTMPAGFIKLLAQYKIVTHMLKHVLYVAPKIIAPGRCAVNDLINGRATQQSP